MKTSIFATLAKAKLNIESTIGSNLMAVRHMIDQLSFSSSFLGSTAQLRSWPPPQNPAEFLGGFSTIFFYIG
jgi:hypothetical protein